MKNPECPKCKLKLESMYTRVSNNFKNLKGGYYCPKCRSIYITEIVEYKK